MMSAGVAAVHPGRQQVGPCLLQGRGHVDPSVEVPRGRVQLQLPAGDEPAHVLLLIEPDQAGTDVVHVDPLPVELGRTGRDVLLDIPYNLVDKDLVSLEPDAAAVAEAEIDRGTLAGRLGHESARTGPSAEDLLQLQVLDAIVVLIFVDAPFQVSGRPLVLASAFEDRGELSKRFFAVARSAARRRSSDRS